MSRKLLVALSAAIGTMVLVPSADAFTTLPVWQCRASPSYTSVNAGNRVEPFAANGNINTAQGANPDHAQCAPAETGAGNTATQIGIPQDLLGARTAGGITTITPELGTSIKQKVTADAKVENVTLQLPQGGTVTLGVNAASSTAEGHCESGKDTPTFTGSSEVVGITLGGNTLVLDDLVKAISDLLAPLAPIVSIVPNEQIRTGDSLTVRALHIKVLTATGGTSLVDAVLAESRVGSNGPVCDKNAQNDGSGNSISGQLCPTGSTYDSARNLCIIAAGTGGSSLGEIIVGKPFQGPSGGTVLPLDVARKRFGASPCLSGSGAPKFAIVGTNRADRITGTNIADRIIGLGGNDRLDGGRGNDCIEGRTGGDNMSGGLDNDKIYGSTGNDHLNGGPGSDYMSAGSGNDTINAAFGKDRALGGSGRDFINIATAGPAASVDCGPGNDVARINNNEKKRNTGCERVAVFGAGDR
jgi:Ca2+-binding RTX toxin-like protein